MPKTHSAEDHSSSHKSYKNSVDFILDKSHLPTWKGALMIIALVVILVALTVISSNAEITYFH